MSGPEAFVDIHCHLVPEIDDGAKSWDETLAMARLAAADGTDTIIVTPHQLGAYAHNDGDLIRQRAAEVQQRLREHNIPLTILPGADVRIEAEMLAGLRRGTVLTLADRRRHVLLELPHELYFPLEPVLEELHGAGLVGILSHPERNQGLLRRPELIEPLVQLGCLMQVTAGSLLGTFGAGCRQMCEQLLLDGLAHFVATDAHGPKSRRPLMRRAYERVQELTDEETALALCCHNPAAVAAGNDVVVSQPRPRKRGWSGFFGRKKVA